MSAYIFGAICPRHGKGAALVLPRCNAEAMSLHAEPKGSPDLAESAAAVAPGAHAALLAAQHHPCAAAAEVSCTQPG